jgi:hypothetical protein
MLTGRIRVAKAREITEAGGKPAPSRGGAVCLPILPGDIRKI